MADQLGLEANAARFSGFADLYDRVRPTPPSEIARLVCAYAGTARPALVIDLGSGTGLSTRWCATWADEVIGVEPSADMRAEAAANTRDETVRYVAGWSHDTGLSSGAADVVIAVQALHWMEPSLTFAEVSRVLRPGGVFVALDCDWPPAVGSVEAEAAWARCRGIVHAYEKRLAAGLTGDELTAPLSGALPALPEEFERDPNKDRAMAVGVKAWSKDAHLERLRHSGRFRWCREVCVLEPEVGDADRLVALLRSQGDLQTLLKHGLTAEHLGVDAFAAQARTALGPDPLTFWFTYRVRLGVT
jgi:SAM-dependent methyltransferase